MTVKSEIKKAHRKLTKPWITANNSNVKAVTPSVFWHYTSTFDAIATIERHAIGGQQPKQGGVADSVDGTALFPIVSTPGASWGSAPIFNASKKQIAEAQSAGGYSKIKSFSIDSITSGEILDLIHIDIQGGEEQLIRNSIDTINQFARHLLVGTHSRSIEAAILDIMLDNGWLLELERPAINNIVGNRPVIAVDRVLFFKNGRAI